MKIATTSLALFCLTLPAWGQSMAPVTITNPSVTAGQISSHAVTFEVEPDGDKALQLVHVKCAVYVGGAISVSGQGNLGLIEPNTKSIGIIELAETKGTFPGPIDKIVCTGYGMEL